MGSNPTLGRLSFDPQNLSGKEYRALEIYAIDYMSTFLSFCENTTLLFVFKPKEIASVGSIKCVNYFPPVLSDCQHKKNHPNQ